MNNPMIIEERQADIGNFLVGRLLPFRKKRQVGPFTFIDHMGPATLGDPDYLDVDQHPHIGLSTLTYLLEGEIEHRDSMGTNQLITPGDVGFMTAGKAVTHTERTPAHLRKGISTMHGYQIWVGLPREKEDMEPEFDFVKKEDLPSWTNQGLRYTLVAGEGFGRKSPLKTHSPLFFVDIASDMAAHIDLREQLSGELAIVVTHGAVKTGEEEVQAGKMMISKTDSICDIDLLPETRVLLFGGEPFPEERFLSWNFVSYKKEKLAEARENWERKAFPKVPGDDTYIPFPTIKR